MQPGTKVGRYEIESLIGIGGMGEVYRAHDLELNRPVAIKFLPAEFAQHASRMKRFVQEARAASALNHPNIITVFEIGGTSGEPGASPYFVTEFIDGVTLKEYLASNKLKLSQVLDIAGQIASALVAAHEAGIVHRDIKPDNVMVRRDGYIKVLDFGLAKPTERSSVDSEANTRAFVTTDPGTIMGTVSYMSPEQARGGDLDARTDIWSLGVVLYELITGHLPFVGATPSHVIVSLLENDPPPLSNYVSGLPEAVELIVDEALRKDRDERTQTAKQFLATLRRVKQRIDSGISAELSLGSFSRDDLRTAILPKGVASTADRAMSETASVGNTTSSAEYLVTQIKKHKTKVLALVLCSLSLLIMIGLVIYRFSGRSRTTPAGPMTVTKLTNNGRASGGVISHDGKYVAHVLTTGDKQSLVLTQTGTSFNREVVAPLPGYFLGLTFSPDDTVLYYVHGEAGGNVRALYQLSVLGGEPRRLIYDVDSPVTFSPDGKKFAFIRGFFKEREKAIFVANIDGSGEDRMTTRKAPEFSFMESPAWSPDGTTVAFIIGGTDSEGYFVNIDGVSIADKSSHKISSDRWRNISSIAWLPDGSALIASARDRASVAGSPNQIWQIAASDGAARKLTNDLNYYTDISLAADGRTMISSVSNQQGTVWVAPAGDAAKAKKITTNNFSGLQGVAWTQSNDILYTSVERDNRDVWITDKDGNNQKQLTLDKSADLYPTASRDGRYILFLSNRGVGWGIWRMNIDGTNPIELVKNVSQFTYPNCSADSQWVLYNADAGNKSGLWKLPIDGGNPTLISDKLWNHYSLSPEGKLLALYYRAPELNSPLQIIVMPIEGGEPVKVINDVGDGSRLAWSPDGTAIDYVLTKDGVSNLWRVPLKGGPPSKITAWTSDLIYWFAWSNDGEYLACARGVDSNDLVLIENYAAPQ